VGDTAAIEVRGLCKRYGAYEAVRDLDISVRRGEVFGLLGPNGAGKTTLISAICNLIRVTSGEIRIFGVPHGDPEARRMIGVAEQDVNLDRFLYVEETLIYHGGYYGMSRADARRRAREMMDVFDLRAKAGVRAPALQCNIEAVQVCLSPNSPKIGDAGPRRCRCTADVDDASLAIDQVIDVWIAVRIQHGHLLVGELSPRPIRRGARCADSTLKCAEGRAAVSKIVRGFQLDDADVASAKLGDVLRDDARSAFTR